MYNMLISIKPEYVENIFNGSKNTNIEKLGVNKTLIK